MSKETTDRLRNRIGYMLRTVKTINQQGKGGDYYEESEVAALINEVDMLKASLERCKRVSDETSECWRVEALKFTANESLIESIRKELVDPDYVSDFPVETIDAIADLLDTALEPELINKPADDFDYDKHGEKFRR
jgi:hypothetical protein